MMCRHQTDERRRNDVKRRRKKIKNTAILCYGRVRVLTDCPLSTLFGRLSIRCRRTIRIIISLVVLYINTTLRGARTNTPLPVCHQFFSNVLSASRYHHHRMYNIVYAGRERWVCSFPSYMHLFKLLQILTQDMHMLSNTLISCYAIF